MVPQVIQELGEWVGQMLAEEWFRENRERLSRRGSSSDHQRLANQQEQPQQPTLPGPESGANKDGFRD